MIPDFNADETNHILFKLVPVDETCIIINLKGLVDTYNSHYFTTQVEKIIKAGYIKLIFNFYGVNYMSSTGIGSMIAILKMLKAIPGADMVMYNTQPKVYEVFSLLGMTGFFNFLEEEEKALAFFKAKKSTIKKEVPKIKKKIYSTIVKKQAEFPLIITCPSCNKRMRAPKPGRYRCKCKTIFTINTLGEVK